jgi:hydroxymethylpyrimidine/phosphomethylpyrimidine kinase
MKTPIALSIAGTDPTSGAGIQADLKTFSALGVFGATVVTALVAQNTRGVTAIHQVPADFVGLEIDAVLSDLAVDAVKIGMLSRPDIIAVVAGRLAASPDLPVVLDPVMVAASGDRLIGDDAVAAQVAALFPRAALITPNLHEAARLVGGAVAEGEAEMLAQGQALLALGPAAVLMKGGHASGNDSADVLVRRDRPPVWFRLPRIDTRNTHGTGCTLSSAIAAGLARGAGLEDAVDAAKRYLWSALAAADDIAIGHGRGPVHHFHALWPRIDSPA